MNGLMARGVGRATASVAVVDFMTCFDGPDWAHEVARSLLWVLDVAAGDLGSLAVGGA